MTDQVAIRGRHPITIRTIDGPVLITGCMEFDNGAIGDSQLPWPKKLTHMSYQARLDANLEVENQSLSQLADQYDQPIGSPDWGG